MDEPVNYRMAERSWEMMQKLEKWGVCFPIDEQGNYDVTNPGVWDPATVTESTPVHSGRVNFTAGTDVQQVEADILTAIPGS